MKNITNIYTDPCSNNNVSQLYTDLISNSCLCAHLDKITVSINYKFDYSIEKQLLTALLGINFRHPEDFRVDEGKYRRQRIYSHKNCRAKANIFYQRRSLGYIPPMLLTIHDPDKQAIDDIDSLLSSFGFQPKPLQIELTLDFHNNVYPLMKFFKNHLFLRYHKKGSKLIGEEEITYYIGDTRSQSKAIRIYFKEVNKCKVLRLELVMNRDLIRKIGLQLPLKNINDIDISKYMRFKQLNIKKLLASIPHKQKNLIKKLKNDPQTLKAGNTLLNSIHSLILGTTVLEEQVLPLMEIVTRTKKYYGSNYGRFLDDMPECNTAFFSLLSNNSFLKN